MRGHPRFDPRPRVGATARNVCAPAIQHVSIRAPGWGRRIGTGGRPAGRGFRSAPPGGGDSRPGNGARRIASFRSAPPGGGDAPFPRTVSARLSFDPRPRVGATGDETPSSVSGLFRSAPPGGGDDQLYGRGPAPQVVSIRAPGWGRQFAPGPGAMRPQVSIRAPGWGRPAPVRWMTGAYGFRSAPPGGGDIGWTPIPALASSFDPRPRVGATDGRGTRSADLQVSIRAPGWGRRPGAVTRR